MVPEARATWDALTERVLSATDSSEVDAMMASILPLYTADPERPGVKRMAEAWSRSGACDLAAGQGLGERPVAEDRRPAAARTVRAPTLVITGALDMICGPAHTAPISRRSQGRGPSASRTVATSSERSPEVFREAVLAFARLAVEVIEFGPLTDAYRAELEGDEIDPFDARGTSCDGGERNATSR